MAFIDEYIKTTTDNDIAQFSGGAPQTGLAIQWFAEIEPAIDTCDFVEGLLIEGGASVWYGESNTGKTFAALDLALCVATGKSWQGREVDQGAVLFLALEGGNGIRNRVAAYRQYHCITGAIPFAVASAAIDLTAPNGEAEIVDTVRAVQAKTVETIKLIVIDTLSRSFAGGDENSSADMGEAVRSVDAIRRETGAHVLLIHHSGKDQTRGARGHSLLRAAIDTEVQVSRTEDGTIVAKVEKQRDLPCEGEFAFELVPVTLGTDKRGNLVRSCVVAETVSPKRIAEIKLTDNQRAVLQEVQTAINEHGETARPIDNMPEVMAIPRNRLRNHFEACGMLEKGLQSNQASARISKWLKPLKGKGILGFTASHVWLVDRSTGSRNHSQPTSNHLQPVANVTGNPRNHTL